MFKPSYLASELSRERHRGMLARADRQRLVRVTPPQAAPRRIAEDTARLAAAGVTAGTPRLAH
jgi:hypothetical protein